MGKDQKRNIELVSTNHLSYGFTFGQDGTWNDLPSCDFCGEEYEGFGVQVNMECGWEICPACLLAGPKAVARKVWARHRQEECGKDILDAAAVIGRLDAFKALPRGILALKIAEGYRETHKGKKGNLCGEYRGE